SVEQYVLFIQTPENDSFYTRDQDVVTVTLSLDPKLHENDRIRLYLNNQPYGNLYNKTIIPLTALPRGTYTLKAEVISKTGKGKPKGGSQTITFYKQQTIINRKIAKP
ncbi:MAG TPA: hypothetical protein VJ205_03320, partial [Gammaproteobacteria bacterium]|nr:hypothetical protein [Gammaproteobacteria bacterium]